MIVSLLAEDVSLIDTFNDVTPFVISDFLRLATIAGLPAAAH